MLTFRQATESDCQLIQSLAAQTGEDTYKNILTKAQLDYMFEMMYSIENIKKQMNELHHLFFIVEDDHTPCAYCSIEQKDEFLFNFQKIYAVPTVHGKGIGRYLIEQGIEYTYQLKALDFDGKVLKAGKVKVISGKNEKIT